MSWENRRWVRGRQGDSQHMSVLAGLGMGGKGKDSPGAGLSQMEGGGGS